MQLLSIMTTNVIQSANTSDEEWKSCLSQIDKYDGYLNELRKYGFTLITGLITASSFLGFEAGTGLIHLGVIVVTMILIMVLFWIDMFYQKVNSRVYARGKFIELILKRKLIISMSNLRTSGKLSPKWGNISVLYAGFVIALGTLAFFAYYTEDNLSQNSAEPSEIGSSVTSPSAYGIHFYEHTTYFYQLIQSPAVIIDEQVSSADYIYIGIVLLTGILALIIIFSDKGLQNNLKRRNINIDNLLGSYINNTKPLYTSLQRKSRTVDYIELQVKQIQYQTIRMQEGLNNMEKLMKTQNMAPKLLAQVEKDANYLADLEETKRQKEQLLNSTLSKIQQIQFQIDAKTASAENTLMGIIQSE